MSLAKAKTKVSSKATTQAKAGAKTKAGIKTKTGTKPPAHAHAAAKKSAAKKSAAPKASARKAQKPNLQKEEGFPLNEMARDLAQALHAGFRAGTLNDIEPGVQQMLMGALIKIYAAQIEDGAKHSIVGGRTALTSTDAMIACHSLLKAVDLQVFDLGVWQSWTGR